MKRSPFITLIATLLLLAACGREKVVYSDFRDLPSFGWDRINDLSFDPVPLDSNLDTLSHDVVLVLRHSDVTPIDTIWLAIEETSYGQIIRKDTIPFPLTDPYGKWRGARSHALYEISDTLHSFTRLPSGYQISIAHAMKKERIPGIKNIGIILSRRPHK